MKKYLFFAAAITLMVGCADDSVVNSGIETPVNGELRPITFGSNAAATTRADKTGSDAAALLNSNFVVEGVKSDGTIATQEIVYDHYNVNWVDGTANTTTSNTANWEYVGQEKHAYGPTGTQAIKYWDYAKTQYDFIAYSVGLASPNYTSTYDDTKVQISEIDPSKMNGSDTNNDGIIDQGAYTIKGKATELAKVYIADLVTAYRDPVATGDYQKEVDIKFRSLSAKVRIALYETVPGYSVKDVVFYSDATTKVAPTAPATWGPAHLFTSGGTNVFNDEGTYVVYYPTTGSTNVGETDYNKAHLSFIPETSGTKTDKEFGVLTGSLSANNLAAAENAEAAGNLYLGRSSNTAIYAGNKDDNYYTIVIPNEVATELKLKVDYTLLSTDGNGEVIKVTGATATVPAVYGSWKSGYAYTYLFKISQNTNGKTNPDAGPEGLYPITFDAVVLNSEVDGVQETITTVADPSITTYAKGVVVTANNEYKTGNNIYVKVEGGANTVVVGSTANLYTVTLTDGDTTDGITTASQTINEASVANALAHGTELPAGTWTVRDANKFDLVVTKSTLLKDATEIAATDAPDGNAIAINGAKFTPAAAGTYVFQYAKTVTTAAVYTAVAASTTLTSGKTYFTSSAGAGLFIADGTEVADGTNYFELTTPAVVSEWAYKIIKVE